MADQPTPAQKPRRVRQSVADQATEPPEIDLPQTPPPPSVQAHQVDPPPQRIDVRENRTEFGWPGIATSPFVPPQYYEQFPEPFRPTYDVPIMAESLTPEQARMMEQQWNSQIEHITIINMSSKADQIMLFGSQPGEKVWATVPPFGVIRGPVQGYLNTGLAGSQFSRYQPIGPDHAALVAPVSDPTEAKRRAALIDNNCTSSLTAQLPSGLQLPRCLLHGCPVDGHSRRSIKTGELELLLSLGHAYLYVSSIGQTLTIKDNETGEKRVAYTPDYAPSERDRFGPKADLDHYENLDHRPNVHLFIAGRRHVIMRREAENRMAQREGRQRTGR